MDIRQLRKPPDEDQSNWALSLADIMTLILCFFMLLLAISRLDSDRFAQVAASLESALKTSEAERRRMDERKGPPTVVLPDYRQETNKPSEEMGADAKLILGEAKRRMKTLAEIRAELEARFAAYSTAVELVPLENGVAIHLKGAAFFPLGSADLTPGSIPFMETIAQALAGTPFHIVIEGYTDNLPIQSLVYPSNWELSSARAARVARYLIDKGAPKDKISIVGYAETKPLFPNTDDKGQSIPENQAKNRRVVVQVTP